MHTLMSSYFDDFTSFIYSKFQTSVSVSTTPNLPKENGFCVKSNGLDQNSGVIKLNNLDGNTFERQAACLRLCSVYQKATGCEVIWNQGNRGCYVHTQEVARGNGVGNHACWIFPKRKL